MEKQATEDLFRLIKPACVKLSNLISTSQIEGLNTSSIIISKSIQNLYSTLLVSLNQVNGKYYKYNLATEVPIDNAVAQYVYFPITQLLQSQDLTNDIFEYIFKVTKILIDQCWSLHFNNTLMMLFPLIPFVLTGKGQFLPDTVHVTPSIELQKACVGCAHSLLRAVWINKKRDQFFARSKNPILHFVTVLLQVAAEDKNDEVATDTVLCMQFTIFDIIKEKDLIAVIFPGTVSKLLKLIIENKSRKLNSNIVAVIIDFLKSIIIETLANENYEFEGEELQKQLSTVHNTSKKTLVSKDKSTIRTAKWLELTTNNLSKFLQRLLDSYRTSSSIKIKESLLSFCEELATKCDKIFSSDQVNLLFNCALYLLGNNPLLANKNHFLQKVSSNAVLQLKIFDSLSESSLTVSSILYSSDQQQIASNIKSISFQTVALLKLDSDSGLVLEVPIVNFTQKVIEELVFLRNSKDTKLVSRSKIKDLQIKSEDEVQEFPNMAKGNLSQSRNNNALASYESNLAILSRKKSLVAPESSIDTKELSFFGNIIDFEVEQSLSSFFQLLGKHSIGSKIIEVLLLEQGNAALSKGLCLWVCNNIILGACEKESNPASSQYGSSSGSDSAFVADEFLNLDDAYDDEISESVQRDTTLSRNDEHSINLTENLLSMLEMAQNFLQNSFESGNSNLSLLKDTVWSVSIDTVAIASKFLKQDFESELIDYLYPVIECLSSSSSMILVHAQNAVLQLASNIYGEQGLIAPTVESLILENSDYLLDSLNLKLVNVSITPDTIKVLIVLLKIAGVKLIEKLEDVVNSSFVLLDMYHGYSALSNGFFTAFNEILSSVCNTYLGKEYDFDEKVFKKHREEIENRNKPWDIKLIDAMFELVDDTKKEIPTIDSLTLEQKDEGIRDEADSDDEEYEGSTQVGGDEEEDGTSRDLFKYTSHIPRNIYLLVQRIGSYCIRFFQYPSLSLKMQIFDMLKKIIVILSTQLQELNPVLYELWPYVLNNATEVSDVRLNISSMQVIYLMLKYGGTFLNKNFMELWPKLQKNENFIKYNQKLKFFKSKYKQHGTAPKEEHKDSSLVTTSADRYFSLIKFGKECLPAGLEFEYYKAVNEVLVLGLSNCGDSLSISTTKDIIENGCGFTTDFDIFGLHSDVAWYLFNFG